MKLPRNQAAVAGEKRSNTSAERSLRAGCGGAGSFMVVSACHPPPTTGPFVMSESVLTRIRE